MFRAPALVALLVSSLLAGCAETEDVDVPCTTLISEADGTTEGHTKVLFRTSKGNFTAELFDEKTPITVDNFKKLVAAGFYKDLLFHRVIKGFMIQTGGMKTDGQFEESPYPTIKNEARQSGCPNIPFTLSMARQGGTAANEYGADTATNQFFVNTGDNRDSLDPGSHPQNPAGYAVFGVVYLGRDVVTQIENTPVTMYNAPGANPHCQADNSPSCPTTDVILYEIKVI